MNPEPPQPVESSEGKLSVCVLGSGSRGNSIYVSDGATSILVDAGFSAREIDRRMRFLTKRLELAEIVDPADQQNRDQVFFGATVLYADQTGLERRVTIVGVDEAEPLNGKISWISPVARALNKARVGDTITLRTPGGVDELDILEVSYADT